jgi:hypothetical protein
MNTSQLIAQLKSAAYGLAAIGDTAEAIRHLERLLSELKDAQWNGR